MYEISDLSDTGTRSILCSKGEEPLPNDILCRLYTMFGSKFTARIENRIPQGGLYQQILKLCLRCFISAESNMMRSTWESRLCKSQDENRACTNHTRWEPRLYKPHTLRIVPAQITHAENRAENRTCTNHKRCDTNACDSPPRVINIYFLHVFFANP